MKGGRGGMESKSESQLTSFRFKVGQSLNELPGFHDTHTLRARVIPNATGAEFEEGAVNRQIHCT
jgi:hypothetical protein